MPFLQNLLTWLGCLITSARQPTSPSAFLGNTGENLATQHLRKLGWRIIIRNWRHGRDEIDIVARDGKNLVFIEVKTRTTTGSSAYHAVNRRKRKALARACRAYMKALPTPIAHFRFDIIEVKCNPHPLSDLNDNKGKKDTFEIVHHRAIPLFSSYT